MNGYVSHQDVARAAGVCQSTVSRVLSGKDEGARITPETRDRIRSVARQLGYLPGRNTRFKPQPQAGGGQQSAAAAPVAGRVIGLVVSLASPASTLALVPNQEPALAAAGFTIVLVALPTDPLLARGRITALTRSGVAGLLCCPSVYSTITAIATGACPVTALSPWSASSLLKSLGVAVGEEVVELPIVELLREEPVVVVPVPVIPAVAAVEPVVGVETPTLPPVVAVPKPVIPVVVPVEMPVPPSVVVAPEPVIPVATLAPELQATPNNSTTQQPTSSTPEAVVPEPEPVPVAEPPSQGTDHLPETPHPGPLPQGAREAETVAETVVADPATPEPVVPVAAEPVASPAATLAPELQVTPDNSTTQQPASSAPEAVVPEPESVPVAEPPSLGTDYHPETPHPSPLPQGPREVETVAAPVVVEPVAPEPVLAPEVQEEAPEVTVTESPGADAADAEAAQVAEPIAQPSKY